MKFYVDQEIGGRWSVCCDLDAKHTDVLATYDTREEAEADCQASNDDTLQECHYHAQLQYAAGYHN